MPSRVMAFVRRAITGAGGGAMFAAANFLLSVALQQSATVQIFGLYAFVQVVLTTAGNFSGAIFGGPALVALSLREHNEDAVLGSFLRAHVVYAIAGAAVLAIAAFAVGANRTETALVAILGMTVLARLFFRSLVLALRFRRDAAFSDILYFACVVGGFGLAAGGFGVSIVTVVTVQCVGSIVSLAPMARTLVRAARGALGPRDRIFSVSFIRHGRWALAASIANAVTGNLHAYFLALGLGAAIFGPVALATLMFRPLAVALNSLIQFERPAMARNVVSRSGSALDNDVRFVALVAGIAWGVNVLVAVALVFFVPHVLLREGYSPDLFFPGAALISAIVLVRALREPKTAALQAAGAYAQLARIAFVSAPVTAAAVAMTWLAFPSQPALILVGTLSGELVALALIRRSYRLIQAELAHDAVMTTVAAERL